MRFDLHVHSNCSDGSDTPEELVALAAATGLQGISITDHDSIDAYQPEVFALAAKLDLKLLPGIELSTEWEEQTVHLLGYAIDYQSTKLRTFLKELIRRRQERNRAMLEKLAKKGMYITEDELNPVGGQKRTIGRPHIAHAMLQKGYVSSLQEAFEKYLREGAPCFVAGIKYKPEEGIQIIREVGGKAVLAHPHFIKKGKMLNHLLSLPFDGIECYYSLLLPDQEAPWIELAKKKGWIATGGSDYHGKFKPNIQLGCSWVNEETLDLLLSK